jgi:hypothetical protein
MPRIVITIYDGDHPQEDAKVMDFDGPYAAAKALLTVCRPADLRRLALADLRSIKRTASGIAWREHAAKTEQAEQADEPVKVKVEAKT